MPGAPATFTATYRPVTFSFAEGFDDGDSSGWTVASGTWTICPPPNGAPGFAWCGGPPPNGTGVALADTPHLVDGIVEATTLPADDGGKVGLIARAQDPEHYYTLRLADTPDDRLTWRIQRRDGSTMTTLAIGAVSRVAGATSRLRLTVHGDQLLAELSTDDGQTFTELGQAVDATYASGKIGLESRLRTNPFDTIIAVGFAPGPGPAP